ncbi:hypothetical protein [Spongorhabdus nitratireducens]
MLLIYKKAPDFSEQHLSISRQYVKKLCVSCIGFAVFIAVASTSNIYNKKQTLRALYEQGRFHVVEGIVEDFDPMTSRGNKNESFTVNGVMFKYSGYRITQGFNQTASEGGPVREGLPVRVSYIDQDNTIIKLETGRIAHN